MHPKKDLKKQRMDNKFIWGKKVQMQITTFLAKHKRNSWRKFININANTPLLYIN